MEGCSNNTFPIIMPCVITFAYIHKVFINTTRMTTSISNEAFEKKEQKVKKCKIIQWTKKSFVEKRTKCVIEQMFSDHKMLRNEKKHFIKNNETLFTIIS